MLDNLFSSRLIGILKYKREIGSYTLLKSNGNETMSHIYSMTSKLYSDY